MNCRNCGIPVGPQQSHCPSCGTPVQDMNNLNNNNNMQNMMGIPNVPNVANNQSMSGLPDMTMYNNQQMLGMPTDNSQQMLGMSMDNSQQMPDMTMYNNQQMSNIQQMSNMGWGGNTVDNSQFNNMMSVMEPSNVSLASDAKRSVPQQNNQAMQTVQNNGNNMFNVMEPSNVSLASDAKRSVPQQNNQTMQTVQNNNNSMMSVAEPSNVSLASDGRGNGLNQQMGQHIDPSVMASSLVNPPNPPEMNINQNMGIDMNQSQPVNEQNGMYYGNLELPDESKKKRFPWFIAAAVLVVIMVVGVFILPLFNKINLSTYEGDQYTLQYNANWSVDEEKDVMTLYYSDKNSRFMFNALSSFKALNSSVENDASKKELYNQFYNAWSDIDGGELTGGTETFISLNAETLYARVDYAITGGSNVGSFYVIVSEKNDKVISFMTFCTSANKDEIDKEVLEMLESLTYKKESESSIYDKFKSGETKEYTAIGYMTYDVPECWTYDESRTKSVEYKSNIFKFTDGVTLLDIKGVTPYNSATASYGTTYESMKATIAKSYGAVKDEKTKTINGKVWYIIVTPDYDAGGMSYHNEIYFTMSATNKHLYYIEAYISNETSTKKTEYLNKSIEYIINSATLYKVDQ